MLFEIAVRNVASTLVLYFTWLVEGWFNAFIGQQEYKTQWVPLEPVANGLYFCCYILTYCATVLLLCQDVSVIDDVM